MERSFYLQIYPTSRQEKLLKRHCIATRILYNETIAWNSRRYKMELCGKSFPSSGRKSKTFQYNDFNNKFPWMEELSSTIRREAVDDATEAFDKFFKGRTKFPKFKNKSSPLQCRNAQGNSIKLIGKPFATLVFVPKIGKIRLSRDNFVPAQKELKKKEIVSTNVIQVAFKQKAGKWFAAISMHIPDPVKTTLVETKIGIDVGCRSLAAISNPDKTFKKKYMLTKTQKISLDELEKMKKKWNQSMARRFKRGEKIQSKGFYEAKLKLQDIHLQIFNLRKDISNKITTRIADELPQKIIVEKLSIKNMLKNKKLAPTISKVGLFNFKQQLIYKSKSNGTRIFEVPNNYPSTQKCPNPECTAIKGRDGLKKQGSGEIYKCEACGFEGNRDLDVGAVNLAAAPEKILTEL